MGMVNKTLLKLDVEEVHLKHEVHLYLFRLGRRIKRFISLLNIRYGDRFFVRKENME
ncbi:MAG: hypothetical protein JW871_08885 [Endomicrobiales bacterium]|nr:hypothetical protein [Endomicrobiales bacterium]